MVSLPRKSAEWLEIKQQVEKNYYDSRWVLPARSFVDWISGLQPLLDMLGHRLDMRNLTRASVHKAMCSG